MPAMLRSVWNRFAPVHGTVEELITACSATSVTAVVCQSSSAPYDSLCMGPYGSSCVENSVHVEFTVGERDGDGSCEENPSTEPISKSLLVSIGGFDFALQQSLTNLSSVMAMAKKKIIFYLKLASRSTVILQLSFRSPIF